MIVAEESAPYITGLKRHRFTVDEVYKMLEAGIIRDDQRLELIRGELVDMSPINPAHAACVKRLNRMFSRLGDRVMLGVQDPIHLSDDTEPEPDIVLARPNDSFYDDGHPQAADIFLLVEVADSSLQYDRNTKLPLYAGAGIREVWIVNLEEHCVEVYRDPDQDAYASHYIVHTDETISIQAFGDEQFDLNAVLPKH